MRQIMIGDSGYVPKHRKDHEKFILSGGPFDEHIVTLSKNAFNTTIFSCGGETGRYIGETENVKITFNGSNQVVSKDLRHPNKYSFLPCLFWQEISAI